MARPWLLIAASSVTVGALFGWGGAVAFSSVAAITVALVRQPWIAVLLVAAVTGLLGAARVASFDVHRVDPVVLASIRAEGMVVTYPAIGQSGPRAVVRVEHVQMGDGSWIAVSGDVLVFFGPSVTGEMGKGDRVRLRWAVEPADRNEAGFRRFVESSGASATARAFHTAVVERGETPVTALTRFREAVTNAIRTAVRGDAGSLLAGFVTGDDSGLSDQARLAFQSTNTSHITAVSGSNVAVLVTMWTLIVPAGRLRRSLLVQLVLVAGIWAYVALVGFGPGAVRAGLFATIMLPAARFGRKADALTALMTASAIMLLVSPGYSGNAGFWLSMAGSAAMVTVLSGRERGAGTFTISAVYGMLAAQLATLPITVWVFDQWSPGSLIANLIVGPLVTVVFPVAFVAAILLMVLPWLGAMFGWIPELGATAVIATVRSMAGDFPMMRTGASSGVVIALLALMSALVLALLSVDANRWIGRLAFRRPSAVSLAPPMLLGGVIGLWVALILAGMWR